MSEAKHTPGPCANCQRMVEILKEALDQLESWNQESEPTFTMLRVEEAINTNSLATLKDRSSIEDQNSVRDILNAFKAIEARVNGEFDNPALVAYGPLSNTQDDVLRIVHDTITKVAKK